MAWINRVPTSTYRQGTKRSTAGPPTLEPLEDRQLLSTCHVTRLSDSGVGKGFRGDLRYCINKVNAEPGADTIDFIVNGTINLKTELPNLIGELKIIGPGASLLTIQRDSSAQHRLVTVSSGIAEISGLTLTNGESIPTGSNITAVGGAVWNKGTLCHLQRGFPHP